MKSLMQEASSILKAIEKAWINAGKPKEFTVRIFQEPEHNFIGMTKQYAKVGIFFGDSIPSQESMREHKSSERRFVARPTERKTYPRQDHKISATKKEEPKIDHPGAEHTIWNPHMIEYATQWLNDALKAMNNHAQFNVQTHNYYLRFTFEKPVIEAIEKERALFRSFSFLLLQALKKDTRRPLRGFKVVLCRKT